MLHSKSLCSFKMKNYMSMTVGQVKPIDWASMCMHFKGVIILLKNIYLLAWHILNYGFRLYNFRKLNVARQTRVVPLVIVATLKSFSWGEIGTLVFHFATHRSLQHTHACTHIHTHIAHAPTWQMTRELKFLWYGLKSFWIISEFAYPGV